MTPTPLLDDADRARMERDVKRRITATRHTPASTRNASGATRTGRGSRWAWAAVAGAAVVALIVAADVSGMLGGPAARFGASAEATELLESAALKATGAIPEPGPGQFLRISTSSIVLQSGYAADSDNVLEHFYFAKQDHAELFIPANRDDEWVWRKEFGGRTLDESDLDPAPLDSYDYVEPQFSDNDTEVLRADGGRFRLYGITAPGINAPLTSGASIDEIPTEPGAALEYFSKVTADVPPSEVSPTDTPTPEESVLSSIIEALGNGTASADQRAAMLRAAALIDGVEVTTERTTFDGQVGIGLGIIEDGALHEMIISPSTGMLIGEVRTITEEATGTDAPVDPSARLEVGTVTQRTGITMTIVDEAP